MTERISKAIDIFLDAVNNGTLAKGNCVACAVGNLVAHGLGCEITYYNRFRCSVDNTSWSSAFYTADFEQTVNEWRLSYDDVIRNIEATDFNIEELMAIEYAFETNTKIHAETYHHYSPEAIRADQVRGLEAVVNVMMGFDDVKADVKEVFTNKLEPVL
jgi:hypothetical protein